MSFSPSRGGLRVGYEVDFSGLATDDLTSGGDGNKTIDGITWTATGTASASTFAVTNGTGIEIAATTTGTIGLYIDPQSLDSQFRINDSWRLWLKHSVTQGEDYEGSLFWVTADPYSTHCYGVNRQRSGGSIYRFFYGNSLSADTTATSLTGDDVFVIDHCGGVLRLLTKDSGLGAGVLPDSLDGFLLVDSALCGAGLTDPITDGDCRLTIALFNSNATTTNSLTLEALRLEIGQR